MHDVTCLGELLIDFTSLDAGASIIETRGFEKHAGGGPANVAVGVSRLGGSAAFLGMVGNDEFGRFLAKELADRRVDVSGLRFSNQAHTTLAFVALRNDGERDFIFYRNPGADMLYSANDIDRPLVAGGRYLHHGSISLISAANRDATLQAISLAKRNGAIISYDPNLRLNLWESPEEAHAGILLGLPGADIVKVSEEELCFITGKSEVDRGMTALREAGIPIVVVTLGEAGCAYSWGDARGRIPAQRVTAVDTTGAGDAFAAGLLYRLSRHAVLPLELPHTDIESALAFANAVAARVVTRRGAIPAMPSLEEIE